ncbi:MAG: sugar phosphate isomerase/epimerase family protein [Planctomycetota bacterium]|jgi:sugar phosphate isomerase/epimerase
MRLGVYSLVTPDYRADEAAALVAEIGYEGIEWTVDYQNAVWDGTSKWHINSDDLEATATAARQAAERNGLAIPCLGTRCACFEPERVRHYMDVARLVGSPAIRVMAPRYDGTTHYDELLARARDAYAAVEQMAAEMGVVAIVELHNGLISTSASSTRRLLEGRDPRWVGAMFDPGNMIREGMENWRMGIEILGPYLRHVHVKDGRWVRGEDGRWQTENTSLPEGMVDWPQVIDGLKSAGYEGFLDIEDFRGGYGREPVGITTRQKLQEDYDYLCSLL